MKNLVNSLSKYTGLTAQNIEEAMQGVQEQIVQELMEQVEKNLDQKLSVEYDENEDGKFTYVDFGDFMTWLKDTLLEEYILEKQ